MSPRIRLWPSQVAAVVMLAGVASSSAARAEDFAGDVPDRVLIDVGGAFNEVSTGESGFVTDANGAPVSSGFPTGVRLYANMAF